MCKGYRPLSTCENVWLWRLVLYQSPCVLFLFQSSFVEEVLPTMIKKTMYHHVLLNLALATMVYVNFDLWMSCGGVDTFVLVINFLSDNWVPMTTAGLFEMNETIGDSMVIQLQVLLDKFGLLHLVTTFVKDESTNLSTMAIVLHSIIDYEPLKILKVYKGTCFGHVMSKASLQKKTITWTKKFRKGKQEW